MPGSRNREPGSFFCPHPDGTPPSRPEAPGSMDLFPKRPFPPIPKWFGMQFNESEIEVSKGAVRFMAGLKRRDQKFSGLFRRLRI